MVNKSTNNKITSNNETVTDGYVTGKKDITTIPNTHTIHPPPHWHTHTHIH